MVRKDRSKGGLLRLSGSTPALRHLVTERNIDRVLGKLQEAKRLIVDTETTGLDILRHDRVCGVSIGLPNLESFYFPIRHESGHRHDILPDWAKWAVIDLLEEAKVITGYNTKFDMHGLMHEGLRDRTANVEDVMLAAHLANENHYRYGLKELASKLVREDAADEEKQLKLKLAEYDLGPGQIAKLPAFEVMPYACSDVQLTEQMRRVSLQELDEWSITDIWQEVNQYMLATGRMERRGMLVDRAMMERNLKEAQINQAKAERVVHRMAGYPINLRSAPQLQKWLKVPSTAVDKLEESGLSERKDVKALLTYRAWKRVSSAYYEAYLKRLHQMEDGGWVLHPNIKLHGTISGRPSADNPAMQAIPRQTDIYRVKDVFIARPGYVLVSADYSQAEIRVGAHYARDKRLIELLHYRSVDIHGEAAAALNIPRDAAKRINFGSWYGLGVSGLAQRLHISEKEAAIYWNAWHDRHPNVRKLYRWLQRQAESLGYIRLWTGRMRRYDGIRSEPHKAMSNLIQGGVAEMMRVAITNIDRQFDDVHMLLQVHDQILMEIPDTPKWKSRVGDVVSVMGDAGKFFKVPMFIDVSAGKRWGQLKPLALKHPNWRDQPVAVKHENQWRNGQ